MSKDFVDNEIDEAHALIKQGAFSQVVGQLKLLGDTRVHDESLKREIEKFELERDRKLDEEVKRIDASNADPLRKDNQKGELFQKYAVSYLNFYDKLRKDHEIF